MSKIQIVDAYDRVIGAKLSSELDVTKDIYRVTCLWMVNDDNLALAVQRAYTKKHFPGAWAPSVTGTVEEGETYESNIVKEIDEELGLKALVLMKGPKTYLPRVHGGYNHFTQWYFARWNGNHTTIVFDSREVAEIKWVSANGLEKMVAQHGNDCAPLLKEGIVRLKEYQSSREHSEHIE